MKGTTLKTRPELRLFQGAGLMCRDHRIGMGPSGFEPESSGPEPPRIDQATPRTRVTRGRCGVTIRVARGYVSIRDRFGFLFSSDLSCSASGYSAARLD